MLRNPRAVQSARRSTFLAGIAGISLLLSLSSPLSAQAAESGSAEGSSPPQSLELTPSDVLAVSDQQITAANRGAGKFSSGDLLAKVRDKLTSDRTERELRLAAEEAARLKAEEEARAKAEAEAAAAAEAARVEAERVAAEKRAAENRSSSNSSRSFAPSAPSYSGGGSKDEWLRASGIAESDWSYVDYIVSKESSWNPNAVNSSSGASGLVQALPCGKVPGSCFNPVDNLKWADGYAKGRYGSWEQAYSFWVTNHWW